MLHCRFYKGIVRWNECLTMEYVYYRVDWSVNLEIKPILLVVRQIKWRNKIAAANFLERLCHGDENTIHTKWINVTRAAWQKKHNHRGKRANVCGSANQFAFIILWRWRCTPFRLQCHAVELVGVQLNCNEWKIGIKQLPNSQLQLTRRHN